jgi:hypothetical protein
VDGMERNVREIDVEGHQSAFVMRVGPPDSTGRPIPQVA